jgi:hypothetical protein
MTDLFEDEDEDEGTELVENFTDIEDEAEAIELPKGNLDARRRLEYMLEEKRLRDELDDFVDY